MVVWFNFIRWNLKKIFLFAHSNLKYGSFSKKISYYSVTYHIGGGMVRMLASTAIDSWFEPQSGQTKVFVASPLCTQHQGVRAKTGFLGIRIICLSGAAHLPADCFFSELAQ